MKHLQPVKHKFLTIAVDLALTSAEHTMLARTAIFGQESPGAQILGPPARILNRIYIRYSASTEKMLSVPYLLICTELIKFGPGFNGKHIRKINLRESTLPVGT